MNESNHKCRPWDKTFSRGKPKNNTSHYTNSNTPFILIDGTPYFSDRFYLNTPTGCLKSSAPQPSPPSQGSSSHNPNLCKCQAPPPLFDRSRLIKSLDLVAVIASTYVIDADWLHHELPMLFPPPPLDEDGRTGPVSSISQPTSGECIPTLVLHGHRGLRKKKKFTMGKRPKLQACHRSDNDRERLNCNPRSGANMIDDVNKMEDYEKNTTVKEFSSTPEFVKENSSQETEYRYTDPKASLEMRLSCDQTHTCNDGNTDLTETTFNHNTLDKIPCVICVDDERETRSNYSEKKHASVEEVVVIEIEDESDVESEASHEEIQVIKCVPAPFNYNKSENCKSPKINVASLASKHQKALYQSPVYEQNTIDVDTDTDSEEDFSSIKKLSDSNFRLDEVPPEEGWRKRAFVDDETAGILENDKSDAIFGKSVYLTEILPRWMPTTESYSLDRRKREKAEDVVDLVDDSSSEVDDIGVDPDTVARRKPCVGVHHPKYTLLFERRGSIVVIVSTSNLTRPSAVDGSWIQRFEPSSCRGIEDCQSADNIRSQYSESDFGFVLCDFIQRQSDAAKEEQILPIQFLRKYLGRRLSSLDDFRRRYRFDQARVHLVSTVPGSFRRRAWHLKPGGERDLKYAKFPSKASRRVVYGPQRVGEITSRVQQKQGSETMIKLSGNRDRLILQTTSFGCNWKSRNFEDLARIYLGLNSSDSSYIHARRNLLDRVDVVWPSQDFMTSVVNAKQQALCDDATIELSSDLSPENFTFLSTKTFNSIDLECISRMAQYESCNPSPIAPWILSPHIKTISRVLGVNPQNNLHNVNQCDTELNEGANFAWVMLTSACLSRGAQGIAVEEKGLESEQLMYTNFELGVLFCSRLQGNHKTDRLYSCYPPTCSCHKKLKNDLTASEIDNIIPLPIPYKIRPSPYQLDSEEADFVVTPCFHEITPGTEVTGQMMLTPFGKSMSMVSNRNA